ncbi:reverse transcriptase domain-containing protein [Streptomyces sp. NPDC014724]|uniref:reverse transcriptase domain-containing protein n=1 Tax=unclassified Streptomyces TaxID=2593676 RepID=UPI0036F974BD
MQSAETVLGVLRERGRRGLPCEELYRQMFNPQLYLLAYGRIYSNKGAMTPGVTQETVDGMSTGRIDRIIDAMRHERYRFRPARRVYIPKKQIGKTRPLGLPTWSDKLVGEVVRLLLEAYYEPVFSGRSHGFRPRKGCHTALREVVNTWTGTTWFIEGDIADCFGSLDHEAMLRTLSEKVHDSRFLRLVRNMLTAGYLEDWTWRATLSGAPQGGVASPVLSNIYLHKLDTYVEQTLIPEYNRGRLRARSTEYRRVESAIARARRRGDREEVRSLYKRLHRLPSQDPNDPDYRRLRYVRYADDTLLGFVGPKAEAEEIKRRLAQFLREDLKLELSQEKTLITHARTGRARFLGYEISTASTDRRTRRPSATDRRNRRSLNGTIVLHVPAAVIKAKSAPFLARGKPACQNSLVNESDHVIVGKFAIEYRGVVQYYLMAGDVFRLHRLRWVMETAMLRTLARKHGSTVSKMAARFKAKIQTPYGPRTCFEARMPRDNRKELVARFGGIPLKRQKAAELTDRLAGPAYPHKELIRRLQGNRCDVCGQAGEVEVHHIRSLNDLSRLDAPSLDWMNLMARRRRKTLVVCGPCHERIHAGKPNTILTQ